MISFQQTQAIHGCRRVSVWRIGEFQLKDEESRGRWGDGWKGMELIQQALDQFETTSLSTIPRMLQLHHSKLIGTFELEGQGSIVRIGEVPQLSRSTKLYSFRLSLPSLNTMQQKTSILITPNRMNTCSHPQEPLPSSRAPLSFRHTLAKSFLRNPSGNIKPYTLPSPLGHTRTSTFQHSPHHTSASPLMSQSEVFLEPRSTDVLTNYNGLCLQTSNNPKYFKRVLFREEVEGKEGKSSQMPPLNFTKTPKSCKQYKSQREIYDFSNCRTARSNNETENQALSKSTENSDISNLFSAAKKSATLMASTSFLTFKNPSRHNLSQLVDKEIPEIDAVEKNPRNGFSRRGSLQSDEKPSVSSTEQNGEGLPTHLHTRQMGGGTFSNSYPSNNPFLKFKASERMSGVKHSKIMSKQSVEPIEPTKTMEKGDFEIGKRLGKGKYGDVYLARHRILGFTCAMKIIQKELVRREKVQNQLCRQIKILHCLQHPNVISLYGCFCDQHNVYLLLELCSSGNLFQLTKQRKRLTQPQTITVVNQLCRGVEYLHIENIIHRDIKPENIIIENGLLKLCDFGWAVYCQDNLRSTFCGTPLYVSPEVLRGEEYDQKIDVWAIGILTYELLVGRIPFQISSEADLAKIIHEEIVFPEYVEVSELAKDFILKILKRAPEERGTIGEVIRHPFLSQKSVSLFMLE